MEEIEVNGKKYILKEDIEKEFVKKENKFSVIDISTDDSAVMGFGSAELQGEWIRSRIAVDYLENAVKCFKELKIESVDVVFTKEYPVVFGRIKNNRVSGIIIAPRIEN